MVVGNGMIAKRFIAYQDDNSCIIFASGVSNSSNKNVEQFNRETYLLEKTIAENPLKALVYFSTCSIYDNTLQSSSYVAHKIAMEQLIKKNCIQFIIFRVSNPVGVTSNPHIVLNYFIDHIVSQKYFTVWRSAGRNLIDLDDMYQICHTILSEKRKQQAIINIANPYNYSVAYIISVIESHFGKKGIYDWVDKGSSPQIDVNEIIPIIRQLQIQFGEDYLCKLLQKYYPVS